MRAGWLRKTMVMTAAAVAAAGLLTPAAGAAGAATVTNYVAMGDSFAAGSGVAPAAPGTSCQRSLANYAHVLAAAKHYRLTDVSCGGATTEHFFASQQRGVRPQLAALSAKTDLVTFGIGGNDNGVFAMTIAKCAAVGGLGTASGSPCGDLFERDLLRQIRTQTYPNLVRAFRAVKQKAPNARVFALNYMWLVPDRATVCPAVPIARGDMATAYRIQSELSTAIERAAARTGVAFVDVAAGSVGHDACTPRGVRYVEPMIGADQLVILHPNALGERHMATVVADAI